MARSLSASFLSFAQSYPEVLLSAVLLSAASLVILFYFQQSRLSSRVCPVNWPIVRMLPGFLANVRHMHDWVTALLQESGCTILLRGPWFSSMEFLLTADPANANQIFNVNFPNYPKGDGFSEIFDILGDGIFTADGESWKGQRQQAHALMTDRRFRSFTSESSYDKVERGLLPLLTQFAEQDNVVDLQDVFLRLTFDLTCNLVFGVDPGCLATDFPSIPFAKAADDAMVVLFLRHIVPAAWWKLLRWLGLGEERKLARAWKVIDDFVAETTSKRSEDYNNKKVASAQTVDLLTSYIEASRLNPIEFDHKFLRDTTVNLMLAGRDTTGAALSWFSWLITENPRVEMRLLEELKVCTSLTCKDGVFLFDTKEVGRLVYLHAALCEALRLYPPLPFETKSVLRPEFLPNGARVGTSTTVLFSLYSMARMERIWGKDCMEFKPERWISDNGKLRHEPSYKFISFNSGPRTCLGRDIAFTQMKAVAAAMVYNFRLEVVVGHVVEPKLSIILHMKNGLKVRIRKRAIG